MARRRRLRIAALGGLALAVLAGGFAGATLVVMPGKSHTATLPPLSPAQAELQEELARDVQVLAGEIGPRHAWRPEALERAALFVERELAAAGHAVARQEYTVGEEAFRNLAVEIAGVDAPEEIVVVGAHYDSVATDDCPGANDNATGVAALLALARRFSSATPARTLRFVAFVNEEPPFFPDEDMGSRVCARACRERGERVVAMLSLETLGCFSDEPGSQAYPPLVSFFYPDVGNFIAFVGNVSSRALVRRCVRVFRERATIPSQGGALPGVLPGVGWSDHASFWKEGYDAVMVTDTAPFRYAHYHTREDTPDKVDYERLARVVDGLRDVVADLAQVR